MLIRVLLAILAAYLVMSAAYVVLILLLVAGLIFRTKETLGLIALCWLLSLFSTHPVVAGIIVVVMMLVGAMSGGKDGEAPATSPEAPVASELPPLPPPSVNATGLPDRYDVILTGDGGRKIQVVKEVRALTEVGLTEAKAIVEQVPQAVLSGVSWSKASAAKATLEAAGGAVEVKIHMTITLNPHEIGD